MSIIYNYTDISFCFENRAISHAANRKAPTTKLAVESESTICPGMALSPIGCIQPILHRDKPISFESNPLYAGHIKIFIQFIKITSIACHPVIAGIIIYNPSAHLY